jgi:predicted transcriptional regulator of viral defense system
MPTQRDRALVLLGKRGIMRLSDLTAAGVHAASLARLVEDGTIVRAGRGLYELADRDVSLSHDLAEMAVRVPKGVICLISALAHHEITLQNPRAVWMAIGPKDRNPAISHRAVRFVHFGEAALQAGVQRVDIDGVAVRIFSPAKTIVDCFRYRRIVGLDVALEALRLGVRSGRARPADIARLAKSLRIWSVLRPYLEAVTADDT